MTPSKALTCGASKLVIGRAITKNANPSKAFKSFISKAKKKKDSLLK